MPVPKSGVDEGVEAGDGGGMPGDRSAGSSCALAFLFELALASAIRTYKRLLCDPLA